MQCDPLPHASAAVPPLAQRTVHPQTVNQNKPFLPYMASARHLITVTERLIEMFTIVIGACNQSILPAHLQPDGLSYLHQVPSPLLDLKCSY